MNPATHAHAGFVSESRIARTTPEEHQDGQAQQAAGDDPLPQEGFSPNSKPVITHWPPARQFWLSTSFVLKVSILAATGAFSVTLQKFQCCECQLILHFTHLWFERHCH